MGEIRRYLSEDGKLKSRAITKVAVTECVKVRTERKLYKNEAYAWVGRLPILDTKSLLLVCGTLKQTAYGHLAERFKRRPVKSCQSRFDSYGARQWNHFGGNGLSLDLEDLRQRLVPAYNCDDETLDTRWRTLNALMGRSEAVTQWVLIPQFEGSNPSASAI